MKVVAFPGASKSDGTHAPRVRSRVAALDIGSTKICCLIGDVQGASRRIAEAAVPEIKVIGSGHCRAAGVRAGHVVDVAQAERAIRTAIEQAERMSGATLSEVFVNLSGGQTRSVQAIGSVSLMNGQVSELDKRAAMTQALASVALDDLAVVHVTVNHFDLDGARGIAEPEGMHGRTLTADINVVLADPNCLANLGQVLERCHLDVAGFVVSPYASARSALHEDELELGALLVELGGGVTTFAAFNQGTLLQAGSVALGAHHITSDIAQAFNTPVAHAERVKTLWGSAVTSLHDDLEMITCPVLGERGADASNRVPRSAVCGVIRPRVEEIFEFVLGQIAASDGHRAAVRRVVLSGGGAQLNGIEQLAAETFGVQVRVARPHRFEGLPDALAQPGFSVSSGLLRYALAPDRQAVNLGQLLAGAGHDQGYFRRVGQWLKESF